MQRPYVLLRGENTIKKQYRNKTTADSSVIYLTIICVALVIGVAVGIAFASFFRTENNQNSLDNVTQEFENFQTYVQTELDKKVDNINGVQPLTPSKKRVAPGGIDLVNADSSIIITPNNGANQIDLTVNELEYQRRISDTCGSDEYMVGALTNGSIICSSLPFDVANGVPQLDSQGFLKSDQLPMSVFEYQCNWNPETNDPFLQPSSCNDTYDIGDFFTISQPSNNSYFGIDSWEDGDWLICSKNGWIRNSHTAYTLDTSLVQRRVQSCSVGSTIQSIEEDGSVNCQTAGFNLVYQQELLQNTFNLVPLGATEEAQVAAEWQFTLSPGKYLIGYEATVWCNRQMRIFIDNGSGAVDGSVGVFLSFTESGNGVTTCINSLVGMSVARQVFVEPTTTTTYTVRTERGEPSKCWIIGNDIETLKTSDPTNFGAFDLFEGPAAQSHFWYLQLA